MKEFVVLARFDSVPIGEKFVEETEGRIWKKVGNNLAVNGGRTVRFTDDYLIYREPRSFDEW